MELSLAEIEILRDCVYAAQSLAKEMLYEIDTSSDEYPLHLESIKQMSKILNKLESMALEVNE
jgi:hypothetical protein